MQKATTGGILTIVSSAIGILTGLFYLIYPIWMSSLLSSIESEPGYYGDRALDSVMALTWAIFIAFFLFYLILGGLGIAGGIAAIKKKAWGLALAGAIAASLSFYWTGIVAVIFVSMAQPEFNKRVEMPPAPPPPPSG